MQIIGYIFLVIFGAFLIYQAYGLGKDIVNRRKNKKKEDKDE